MNVLEEMQLLYNNVFNMISSIGINFYFPTSFLDTVQFP